MVAIKILILCCCKIMLGELLSTILYHGFCIKKKTKLKPLHIYIHNIIGHYNPSVRIIDLVSHTTYVVYVNFIHKWRDLQFKVDAERQIFWETFHDNFIYSQNFWPEICWEERNRRRNTFIISFWCLAWDSNPGFSYNKPTHYLLDYEEFSYFYVRQKTLSHTH